MRTTYLLAAIFVVIFSAHCFASDALSFSSFYEKTGLWTGNMRLLAISSG
jgi:hypothetical protein